DGVGSVSSVGSVFQGRALELDHIPFGVGDVNRRALAFGTITRCNLTRLDAAFIQVATDGLAVEWLYAQAQVVQVASLGSGWGAAGPPEFSAYRHQVDQ